MYIAMQYRQGDMGEFFYHENQTKLHGNWNDVLRDPTNKTELFNFLSMIFSKHHVHQGKKYSSPVVGTCIHDSLPQ